MDLELKGKKVLITGASRGIGAAIAERFLEEGAETLLVSRGSSNLQSMEKRLQDNFGSEKVSTINCDCTNLTSLLKLHDQLLEQWGRLDILIANVGDGRSEPDPLPSLKQWKKTWTTNFESAHNTSRTFLKMLQESKGAILFISSIVGVEAMGAPVDYSTAKTAVIALAKNMSRKLAKDIRVNVLAPGNILFPGGSWSQKIDKNPKKIKDLIRSTVPMNRFGTPDEVADAAVFLCSNRASFITGSLLTIDGGQTMSIL